MMTCGRSMFLITSDEFSIKSCEITNEIVLRDGLVEIFETQWAAGQKPKMVKIIIPEQALAVLREQIAKFEETGHSEGHSDG